MQNHDGRRTAIFYGLGAAAWLCVLFWFSGQSGSESGALSERVARLLFGWLADRGVSFDFLHTLTRKLAHFGAFAVEGWLLGSALLRLTSKGRAAKLTGFGCGMIAVLNELHQTMSVGRSCDVRDMLIDTCGALIGLAFAVAVLHAFSKLQSKNTETIGD